MGTLEDQIAPPDLAPAAGWSDSRLIEAVGREGLPGPRRAQLLRWAFAGAEAASRGVGDDGRDLDLNAQRARLAKWQADIAELKAGQMRAELVETSAVEQAVVAAFVNVRARLLAIPAKAAPRVAGKSAAEVQDLLRGHVEEALRELSEMKVVLASADDDGADGPEEPPA